MVAIAGFEVVDFKKFSESEQGRVFHATLAYEGEKLIRFHVKKDGVVTARMIEEAKLESLAAKLKELIADEKQATELSMQAFAVLNQVIKKNVAAGIDLAKATA